MSAFMTRSAAKVLREQRYVFEMQDFLRTGGGSRRETDLYDVEAKRPWRCLQLPQVRFAGSSKRAFLALIDRVIPGNERVCRPRFHFDEDQDLTIATNQIDLLPPVMGIAPVAREQRELPLAHQPVRREALSTVAAGLGRPEYFSKEAQHKISTARSMSLGPLQKSHCDTRSRL